MRVAWYAIVRVGEYPDLATAHDAALVRFGRDDLVRVQSQASYEVEVSERPRRRPAEPFGEDLED